MRKIFLYTLLIISSNVLFAQNEEDTTVIEDGFLNVVKESVELYKLEYKGQKNYDSLITAFGYEGNHVPTFTDSIYCLRLAKMDEKSPFHFDCHPAALSTIRFFNQKRRHFIKIAMGRSALFFNMYEEALDRHQMPLVLKYLSVIESGLRPQIRSRAGAVGLWQFMYRTGKAFGLEENAYIDERMDPYKATDAACRYLKRLHGIYNDWNMALAAYNAGPGNVNKAIYRSGGKMTYWEIRPYLPRETQGYVPNFIAAAYLMEHAAQHNLSPAPTKVYTYEVDTVCLKNGLHMTSIDSILNWDIENIKFLNPTYKTNYIPKTTPAQCITMPIEKIPIFINMEDSLFRLDSTIYATPLLAEKDSSEEPENIQYHRVKSGQTLGEIAEKYHTSVRSIMRLNNLHSSRINVNQRLRVSAAYTPKKNQKTTKKATSSGEKEFYTIRSGDSLWNISQRYDTSISQLQSLNPQINPSNLKIGQRIRIQ